MEIIFLGTGSSMGTPVIGCPCAVCQSGDSRNQRTRASILVRAGTRNLLVDPGPDLRVQMLREGIDHLDAVFVTHIHADHVNGIDDLRSFNYLQREVIPCYADQFTIDSLNERFSYCFAPPDPSWSKPSLSAHVMTDKARWDEIEVTPVPVMHGKLPILGYRFNQAAYLTDVKTVPESSMTLLRDLDLLILDCLRYEDHPTHLSVDEALDLARRIDARRTIFTHMTHDIDFDTLSASLPSGMELAYDGLHVQVGAQGAC
ncbi:MBL fold metallo-hydrolase [Thermithiobacillus plumbiphilus]|uniref:MBL fold metallo-hydrolase n=1 Tax=Thermithiobacillus plumbiphilus TaxID=1729899 RepID=A0ABU9D4C4_9PROT